MSDPLPILLDGLTAAGTHWQTLSAILLILAASQFLMVLALKRIFGDEFTAGEYYSLSLAGWLVPALLLSLIWYAMGVLLSPQIGLVFTILLFIVVAILLRGRTSRSSGPSKWMVASLLSLTAIFIILRLAFVTKTVLPMYFDSAQHFIFTKNLLASLDPNAPWFLANYYHLGFHFLTAFITFATHTQINDVMLLLGQVILATMPFAVFFIVRRWTRSNLAALFALLLAAFGWYMPAHAVDWGKYPALASLALLPFALCMAYLSIQHGARLPTGKFVSLNLLVLFGIGVTILFHSRALIIFGIAALTWSITALWRRMPRVIQWIVLAAAILALLAEIIWIQSRGILPLLFDPYVPKGLWITIVVLFLSIFVLPAYPSLVLFYVVSTFLLLVSLFIPVESQALGFARLTLLDRPFVEMILYLPLALLGGFGLAVLEQKLLIWGSASHRSGNVIGVLLISFVIVNALFKYDLYPADCCDIASQDDLTAIQWIGANLPPDARILISSTDLNMLPTHEYQGSAGGDAGTWINPLTNRATVLLPFNSDFSSQQTLDTICQLDVGYVYVGKTGAFFDESTMPVLPDAYKVILALPNARLYEVTGCN